VSVITAERSSVTRARITSSGRPVAISVPGTPQAAA
jgi:hypothetical protein